MVKHSNYWFDTCPTNGTTSTGLAKNVDVLIIGGGAAGMNLLANLVYTGTSNVVLFEESTVGYHASGRSSGQLILHAKEFFHLMPKGIGKEYLKFVHGNNKNFINILNTASFDTDLQKCGGLRLASDRVEMNMLKKEAAFIQEVFPSMDIPILLKQDVENVIPSKNFVGGIYIPCEATLNPYKVLTGMKSVIEEKGSRIFSNTCVESVTENTDGSLSVSIRHKGIVNAKKVVYCTNAYTNSLLPEYDKIMTPFRGQMIATDLLPEKVLESLPNMSLSCNQCDDYFRLHGGRLLLGGRRSSVKGEQKNIIHDGDFSRTVYNKLREFMQECFPSIDVPITHTWTGIMCETSDKRPLIGAIPNKPNQYIMAGFNGYGLSHVCAGANIIRRYLNGDSVSKQEVKLFSPSRFSKEK